MKMMSSRLSVISGIARKISRTCVVLSAVGLAWACLPAQATTLTWNVSGDGTWDTTSTNWTGDATTFTSDGTENVIFTAGTAGYTITLSSNMSPASTTVSGDYRFSAVTSPQDQPWTVPTPGIAGSLTKSGDGTLDLRVTPADFSNVEVNGGTLFLDAVQDYYYFFPLEFNMNTVTVNPGATLASERTTIHGSLLTMNGGTYWEDNGYGGSWIGPVHLAADSFFGQDWWCCNQTIDGVISGPGGLTWLGGQYGAWLILNGTSTYTGKTIVKGGTLRVGAGGGPAGLSNAGLPGALGAPTGTNAVIDMYNGATLYVGDSNPRVDQSTDRTINLAADGSGTVSISVNDNDTRFTFGAVTATGTGAKTLALFTGAGGNGDRESLIFNGPISDTSDSQLSLQVTFTTQSGSESYVSLSGTNTFTGPIILVKGANVNTAYLTIGGVRTRDGNNPGSGTLGNGNYPGAISLDATTILEYDSSATQTLSGVISGPGALTMGGASTLTLSGTNTYSGNTTVTSGVLRLTHTLALSNNATVYLPASGGTLNLPFTGICWVAKAYTNGVELGAGVYSNSTLPMITSTGVLGVGTPLLASFTAVPNPGEAPLQVVFTDTSVSVLGTITNWSWDFGNGVTTNYTSPAHAILTNTYALWGTYPIRLIVSDTYGLTVTNAPSSITVTQPVDVVVSSEGQYETVTVNVGPLNTVTFNAGVVNPDFGGLTGNGTFALVDGSAACINLEVGGSGPDTTFSGALTGCGGLTKVGPNKFSLSGTNNTYLGDTVVSNGVLALLGEVLTPGLVAEFYNQDVGQGDGDILAATMGDLNNFNAWANALTPVLNTTTVAYPGDANHYPAHARLWYPDWGNHFYDMGFNNDVLPSVDVNNNYTVRMTGQIKITNVGTYQFGLNSDDGSMLWIDGSQIVFDAYYQGMKDDGHDDPQGDCQVTGSIYLSAGYHDIEIAMNEGGGGHGLNVSYQGLDTATDDGSPVGSNPQYPTQGNVGGWVFIPNSVLGVLTPGGSNLLPTNTTLRIVSPGIVNLAGSTNTVASLYFNGVHQVAGTWGTTGSGADHVNDTFFSGTGLLVVMTLPAPTGLTAQALNERVNLTWSAVSEATGYLLSRASVSNGTPVTTFTTSLLTFLNTGLTNGTEYWYAVAATNGSGPGENSEWVPATPQAPTPPSFLPGSGITHVDPITGHATIKLGVTSNWYYRIVYKDDLLTGDWLPVQPPTNGWHTATNSGIMILIDTNTAGGVTQRFYRIEMQ